MGNQQAAVARPRHIQQAIDIGQKMRIMDLAKKQCEEQIENQKTMIRNIDAELMRLGERAAKLARGEI